MTKPYMHQLKCWPEYFSLIVTGIKTFDLRVDDREPRFTDGQHILFEEFRPGVGEYTGRTCAAVIKYVARGSAFETFGLKLGHVVIGIEALSERGGNA